MVHPATERDFDTNPALPVDQTARVTRRGLLQSIGVGAATAALTAGGFSADDRFTLASSQINATPPASDHIAPANDPVADLAAALNYDMEAIFTFVRDEVHYESYAGVLRGAKGTLWARAGNSADQATLLAELFAASQIPYRFAFGELGPDQVETLAVLMAPDADLLVSSYTDAIIVGFTPSTVSTASGQASPIPEIGLSDEDQSYLDELASNAEAAFTTARSLLDSHLNIIEEALLNSKVTIPESAFTELPTDEIHRHVWIQTPDGPNWIDYAPALGNHEPRTAPGDVTETFTEVPVDLFHNLTFRIIAEEYFGGTTVRRDAISVTTTSSNVVNEPIAFAVVPPAMFTGVGLVVCHA